MNRVLAGFLIGFGTVSALPEQGWLKFRSGLNETKEKVWQIKDFFWFYMPSEMKKRKSEEILSEKQKKSKIRFEILDDSKNDRKKLEFFTDLQKRMRSYEMLANHSGLTKKEKIIIIRQTLKDHYPELFAEYKEIIEKKIEKYAEKSS